MAQYVGRLPNDLPVSLVAGSTGLLTPKRSHDITRASLADFQRVLDGTNTALVPGCKISLRVQYGPVEVKAQIDAAASLGIYDWLLWNPTVTYTSEDGRS